MKDRKITLNGQLSYIRLLTFSIHEDQQKTINDCMLS
jgi:hypothetical protein